MIFPEVKQIQISTIWLWESDLSQVKSSQFKSSQVKSSQVKSGIFTEVNNLNSNTWNENQKNFALFIESEFEKLDEIFYIHNTTK